MNRALMAYFGQLFNLHFPDQILHQLKTGRNVGRLLHQLQAHKRDDGILGPLLGLQIGHAAGEQLTVFLRLAGHAIHQVVKPAARYVLLFIVPDHARHGRHLCIPGHIAKSNGRIELRIITRRVVLLLIVLQQQGMRHIVGRIALQHLAYFVIGISIPAALYVEVGQQQTVAVVVGIFPAKVPDLLIGLRRIALLHIDKGFAHRGAFIFSLGQLNAVEGP